MKIIFDLDGTLICSKRRLYELFSDLSRCSDIDYESYWDLKFDGKKNEDILKHQLGFNNSQIDDFLIQWMKHIEDDTYLNFDSVVPGCIKFLDENFKNNEFYICTSRQSIVQVHKQLSYFAMLGFFRDIFVTEQNASKEEVIRKSGIVLTKSDWFVGDTGCDVITGKNLRMKTCAVLSGFMPAASLEAYAPDIILPNITSLKL